MIHLGDFVRVEGMYVWGVVTQWATLVIAGLRLPAAVLRRPDGTTEVFLVFDLVKVR